MKTLITSTVLAFGLAASAFADPVHGTWASPKNEEGASFHVKISDCGGSICGSITEIFGGADPTIKGERMVWNMEAKGGGEYKGKIWAPDTRKTYNGKMELNGNTLKMSGCILGICRGENFSRLN